MKQTILTVGDSTADTFLQIDEKEASLLCDLKQHKLEIAFRYGDKIPIEKVRKSFGGGALNTSVGFSRLGFSTYIATIMSVEDSALSAIKMLNENGVNTSLVQRQGEANQSTIINYKNERTIFSYHAPRDYKSLKLLRADWIYFASATDGSDYLAEQAIKLAKEGVKIVFNPGSWELRNFNLFKPLVSVCEILIINRCEADQILEVDSIKNQLAKMHDLGAKIAIITDASNGAYISDQKQSFHMGIMTVDVISTTGAGDAFSSAFVASYALGRSIEESAKWGMVNSGMVLEKFGATDGLLTGEEIEKILSENKSLKATDI